MAAAFVNSTGKQNWDGSSSTSQASDAWTLTADNLAVVVLRRSGAGDVNPSDFSCHDSLGNNYGQPIFGAVGSQVVWLCNHCLGGSAVVTVTYPSSTFSFITGLQFSGQPTVVATDQAGAGIVGTSITVSPASAHTNQIAILLADIGGNAIPTITPATASFTSVYTSGPAGNGPFIGNGSTRLGYNLNTARTFDGTEVVTASNGIGGDTISIDVLIIRAPVTVTTVAASSVTSTSATLNGTVTPNDSSQNAFFRWDTVTPPVANDTAVISTIANTSTPTSFNHGLSGLSTDTTYYFRAVSIDVLGVETLGTIKSFGSGEAVFLDGEQSEPLTWIEHYKEDPTNDVPASANIAYAEVDLNDPSSYYLGYKAPLVIQWTNVSRGLSDYQGTLEHLSYGATFSDTARTFRGFLDDVSLPAAGTRFLTNRPTVERMIDDEHRRLLGIPRVIANGFVSNYAPLGGLKFRLDCGDWIRRKGTRSRKSFQKWQPLVLPIDFDVNTTPQGVLNKPAPVIYGSLSETTGAFAPTYTGIRLGSDAVYRSEFLIAAHACVGIPTNGTGPEVFVDDVQVSAADLTANWKLPNTAAYISLYSHGYAEFNGRRYTTLLIDRTTAVSLNLVTADETGPGTSRLTINIDGIETIGDCTGTLITSLVQQCQHFAENIAGDIPWNSQGWVDASPLEFSAISGLTLVDRDSFATVDAAVNLTGAGVIGFNGEAVSLLDVLSRFCLNGDFEIGFSRKGQLIAAYEPEALPSASPSVDDITNIVVDSLSIADDVSGRFWNVQPYRYGEDYSGKQTGTPIFVNGLRIVPPNSGGWQSVLDGNVELKDDTSITNYDQEIEGASVDLHFLRNATDALTVIERRLNRYTNPFRTISFTVPLSGTSIDLGDIFTLTAIDGMTGRGWTDRALRCVRHELDPNTCTVTITSYDLHRVVGSRALGDETDGTAQVLGDETDGTAMVLH